MFAPQKATWLETLVGMRLTHVVIFVLYATALDVLVAIAPKCQHLTQE